MKTKTFLPVFPGFYNTIFEADEYTEIDEVNDIREQNGWKEAPFEAFKFDYDTYYNEISKNACKYIENELKSINIIRSLVFENLQSPQYYNYINDSINIIVDINKKELVNYIKTNYSLFSDYIKENYSSRDGFCSFYSNNGAEWLQELAAGKITDLHKYGALLQFVCENENINCEDMHEYCMNYVYFHCANYEQLITKKKINL